MTFEKKKIEKETRRKRLRSLSNQTFDKKNDKKMIKIHSVFQRDG